MIWLFVFCFYYWIERSGFVTACPAKAKICIKAFVAAKVERRDGFVTLLVIVK